MAMAGVGCRTQSVLLSRPSAIVALLSCHSAASSSSSRVRSFASAARKNSWGETVQVADSRIEGKIRSFGQRLSVRAMNFDVSGPGAVDSPLMSSMQTKIKEQLDAEKVTVKDAYGDGRHVSINVVASVFEGKSAVNRQRMVYKAIWEELQETVHAVDQLRTFTPSEAANLPEEL